MTILHGACMGAGDRAPCMKGRHRECGTGPWTERRGDQFFDLSTRALA